MTAEPTITERAVQPYAGIRGVTTMAQISSVADRLPEIFRWLAARGPVPAGAPFLRYHVINMERELEIEAGVPVAAAVSGDDTVAPGILPAGRYATLTHTGPFSELAGVTARLLAWAGDQGLALDMTRTDDSERWGCRLESYLTDPAREPDPGKWQTELAFRLAG